jgi:hypothetical protein
MAPDVARLGAAQDALEEAEAARPGLAASALNARLLEALVALVEDVCQDAIGRRRDSPETLARLGDLRQYAKDAWRAAHAELQAAGMRG